MHKRTALTSGENRLVYAFCNLFVVAHNETAARTAQSLVRCRRNDVSVSDGALMHACDDKSRNVRNVRHKVCAHFVCNLSETLIIYFSGIRACAADDELRLAFQCYFAHLVVVYALGHGIYAVSDAVEQLAAHIHFCAVREMSAVGKRHAENGVSALQKRVIRRKVCI